MILSLLNPSIPPVEFRILTLFGPTVHPDDTFASFSISFGFGFVLVALNELFELSDCDFVYSDVERFRNALCGATDTPDA